MLAPLGLCNSGSRCRTKAREGRQAEELQVYMSRLETRVKIGLVSVPATVQ